MVKLYTSLPAVILFFCVCTGIKAQCTLTTSAYIDQLVCGQCVSLYAFGQGQGQIVFAENFNSGQPTGWAFTNQAMFNNPCSPGGVDGTPHLWMGNNSGVPRTLRTVNYNFLAATAGVTICFDLLFAEQTGDEATAPCEGPDEPDEGVALQYSTNNGATWIDIYYFDPNGGYDPSLTNWNNWCFALPPGAITAATQIRWFQDNDSGQNFDHWGIDNVEIYFNDPTYNITWTHDGYSYGAGNSGGENPTQVCPQTTTTYTAVMTNGTTTCTSSVTVNVTDPVIVADAGPNQSICPGQCVTLDGSNTRVIMSPAKTPTYSNGEIAALTGLPSAADLAALLLPCFNFGGCTCPNGSTVGFLQTCPAIFTGTISMNINITDLNTVTIQNGQLTSVCISSANMIAGNLNQFGVTLTCPSGNTIVLANPGNITGTNLSNACFTLTATAPISTGSAPYTGNWQPVQPLTALSGCDANGVWTLNFTGTFNLSSGNLPLGFLNGWNISFDDPEISEPAIVTWSPTTNMTGSNTLTPNVCPTVTTTYTITAVDDAGCTQATDQVTVTVAPCCPMTISVAPANGTCGNNGSATLTINNPPVAPTIAWSNGQTAVTATNLANGTYTVTVTAGAGCSQTASVTIANTPGTAPTVSNSQQVCNAAGTNYTITLTLAGTAPINVTGSPGTLAGNVFTSNPITAGTFPTFTITNVCGSITFTPNVVCTPPGTCNSSEGCFGANLVVNGNFESFNPAAPFATFTSSYDYSPCPGIVCVNSSTSAPILCQYDFSVQNNANICNSDWTSLLDDHTSGSGNMMIVDFPSGNVAPNNQIWCQTVNLTPSTNYCFGAFFANILPTGSGQPLPVFGFTVGGSLLGNSPSLPENEQWQFYGIQFNSGAGGNTTLCITNQNFGATGYDLAIDDISVRPVTSGTPPTAVNDNVSLCAGATAQTINVLGNDSPTGGAITSLNIYAAPPYSAGTVSAINLAAGTITFNPAPGFSGTTNFSYQICNAAGCCDVATVTISPNPPPTPSISGNLSFCTGGSTTLTAAGGGTYVWSTGANTAAINVTAGGTYSVTVTNISGCTATASANVTVNSIIPPNMPPASTCAGGNAVTLNPGAYTSYIWTTGATTQTISVSPVANTTYTVTVTNATGCTAIGNVTVTINTILPPSIPPASTCAGALPVTLNAGTYSGYSWSTGATSQTINVSPATTTTYTVNVTGANGCTNSGSVTVTVNSISPPVLTPVSVCAGNPASINAGSGYSGYVWSNGATSQSINVSPSATTSYSVTVTGTGGCTASASTTVTVNNITPPVISPASICAGGNPVTLNAGAGFTAYLWSSGQTTQTINVSPAGTTTYTVTVTATGGCTATANTTVTVNSITPPSIPAATTCAGGNPALLDAGVGYNTYAWSTGASTQSINVSPASTTTYTITVTDNNNCSASNSVTVTVNNLAPFTIPVLPICLGSSTTLNAGAYSSYLWSTGETSQSVSVSPATGTTYTVTVSNSNGCTAVGTATVAVNTLPNTAISGSTTFCTGGNTTLSAGMGFTLYQWSNSATSQSITISIPGTYTVTVTNANGCTATAQTTVTESASLSPVITGNTSLCPGETSTLDAGTGFNSYMWSNGATGSSITVNTSGTYSVTVTDVNGCSGTDSETVVVNTNPNVSITGNGNICIGASSTLNATPGFLQYEWSTGTFGQSITTNTAGSYAVTVTDANGCTDSDVFVVNVNTGTAPVITGTLSFCFGGNTVLNAGSGFSSYLWSNSSTSQTATASTGGVYSVTVTDINGCSGSSAVTVSVNNPSPPVIGGNTNICAGSSTILSTSGFTTYLWSNGSVNASINVSPPVTTTYTVTVTDANGCTSTAAQIVNVTASPPVTINGNTAFCPGGSSLLDAGSGFAQYLWSTGSTGQTITATTAGTYTVTVADGAGCSNTAAISISILPNPIVNISGSSTFCTGSSSTLNAGSGFTQYLWNTGSTTQTLAVTSAGIYDVTVTNANGCTGSNQINVTESTSLNPNIVGNLNFCVGETTVLDAGTGYASYSWNNGGLTQTISVSMSGNYSVTVTDSSGCTGETDATVAVNPNPVVSITGVANICSGQNSTLDAGSGFTGYLWNDGSTGQTLTASTAGTYSVTVTDANGCSGTDNFVLNVGSSLTPVIAGDLDICAGETTTLDAGAGYATYSWSNGGSGQTISITASGIYIVTVTDAGGCTGEANTAVTVNTNPAPTITGTTDICNGETSVLDSGTGFTTYNWSDGSTGQTLSITTTGSYQVTVTNAAGCTGTDSFAVTVNANPVANITGTASICIGQTSTLDAGSGFTGYLWNDGSNGQTLIASTTGTYSVTVTDANGCTGTDNFVLNVGSSLTPVIAGDLDICAGETTTLDASAGYATYSWSSGGTGQTISATASGIYFVTVTDAGGCTGEANVSVTVNANPLANITGTASICIGQTSTLDAGTGYTAYLWNDGSTGQTLTASTTGTYSVTVTDANGCIDTDNFVLNVGSSLTPVIAGDLDICADETTTLDAGAGYATYTWSNGGNGQTISVTASGIYFVTVTDAGGCTGEANTAVTVNTNPAPTITGTTDICNGETSVLDAGTGFTTYSWSDGSTGQILSITSTGSYQVTVTNAAGCTGTDSFAVMVNANPVVNITGTASICIGQTSTLDAGSGLTAYLWNDGSNGQTLVASTAGTYSVTVTDANGCTGTDSFVLNVGSSLTPVIAGDLDICTGETTTLDAGAGYATYTWSNGGTGQTISTTASGIYFVTVTDAGGCTGEANVSVTANANPVANITGTASICIGQTSILDVGTGYTSYLWNDGSTGQTLTASTAGTYSVTVTDTNGCTGTDNFVLNVGSSLTPVIVGDLDICAGETTTLDAGAGYATYTWSNGGNGQTISVTASGIYIVTVTDAGGCTGEANTAVTVNTNPAPTITGTTDICNGQTSVMDAGTGFTNYSWSDGSTDQTLSITSTGSYQVTVTNAAGCTGTDSFAVTVNANPVVNISGTESICIGQTSTLDAGSGLTAYLWNDGSTGQTLVASTAGTYSVTVTDANGCTGTDSFVLNVGSSLTPVIAGDLDICAGETTTLDAGTGYATYSWSNGGTGQTVSVTASGTYIVTVTDAGGCTGESNVSVTVNTNPLPDITGTANICIGEISTLDAGAGYNLYAWNDGSAAQTLDASASGIYTVTVTDANGCTGTDSFILTAIDCTTCTPPLPPVGESVNAIICEGEVNTTPFVVSTEPGTLVNWYDAPAGGNLIGTGVTFTPSSAGVFYAEAVNILDPSCVSERIMVELLTDLVSISVTADPTATASGGTVLLDASGSSILGTTLTYSWTTSGSDVMTCTDCTAPEVILTQTTNFTASVIDEYGCSASASVQVLILPAGNIVVIPNAFSPNGDGVNDLFRVTGQNIETIELFIYNRWGQEVFAAIGELGAGWDGKFRDTDQELGVYVYYANITFMNGETETLKGNITLIR